MPVIRETRMYDGRRVLTAWERRSAEHPEHGTITTIDGVWYGSIKTRRLPAHLDALPALSDERSNAVRSYHASLREEAYKAILEQRPDAATGERDSGEITLPPA